MRVQHTGVVVARGIGMGLILFALSTATSIFDLFVPAVSSGWTSYSPQTTAPMNTVLHDTYFFAATWVPSLVQSVVGAGLILFSKPIGRWLAMGLKDDDSEN
jgi:hypothetical protein